jgi:glycosyltransferase involved in cell wall biosynthesis
MNRILVSHPHAASVALQAASALHGSMGLARFFTGIAGVRGTLRGKVVELGTVVRPAAANRLLDGIRPRELASLFAVEVVARGVGRLAAMTGRRFRTYDALFVFHDAAVASLPWPSETETVYAYEDGALLTFRRAARRGIRRVLDLPLPWRQTIERLWVQESERWPGAMGKGPPVEPTWKKKRKDAELAMADAVSVASAYTRESLESVGWKKPIFTTPYPFPVTQFEARASAPEGPFTVISVGTQDLRKGTPYLLEAWRLAGLKDARLKLIGRMNLTRSFLGRYADLFDHVEARPKSQLAREYQAADLLAFPTLGDGFGLVMQEAMCCGTPVLTTRCGGGPECITNGENGMIIEERSVEALAEALRWAAAHRDRLNEMGLAARRRAEAYTAREFGPRFVNGIRAVLGAAQQPA